MKRACFALWSLLVFGSAFARAEGQSVAELVQGSEFKYTKGSIDIQTVSALIADRQKAISKEVLHRYLLQSQAGSLSQNFLNERLLDLLLNNNTPKEITRGIYTYTMESFALGMLTDALENDAGFQLPKACSTFVNVPLGQGRIHTGCKDSLKKNPLLKRFSLIDSELQIMRETRDFLVSQTPGRGGRAPVSMEQVIEHVSGMIKNPDSARQARASLRATWKAYSQAPPNLAKVHRQFLRDLAYRIALENGRLFSRTLFQKEMSGDYYQRTMPAMLQERWKLDASDVKTAIQVIDSGTYKNAEKYRKEIQEKLRRETLIQYLAWQGADKFELRSAAKELNGMIDSGGGADSACKSIYQYDSKTGIFDGFSRCRGFINSRLMKFADSSSQFEEYFQGRSRAFSSLYGGVIEKSLRKKPCFDKMDSMLKTGSDYSEMKKSMKGCGDFLSTISKSTDELKLAIDKILQESRNLKRELPTDRAAVKLPMGEKAQALLSKVCKNDSVHFCIKAEGIDTIRLNGLSSRMIRSFGAKKLQSEADLGYEEIDTSELDSVLQEVKIFADKVGEVSNYFGDSAHVPLQRSFANGVEKYKRFVRIAGGSDSSKIDFFMRKALVSLNRSVAKDTSAARFLASYDHFLKMWAISSDHFKQRDSLSGVFLRQYLPVIRGLSFADSGMKAVYESSSDLIEFASSEAIGESESTAKHPALIQWLGAYSTRKRSQNLQAALQLLRENDSLFKKVLPDSGAREWFWLVTGGLEIDTAVDVIAMDIPKMLTKIEKKYQVVAKKDMRFYPVLDIGIFMARVGDNNSDTVQWAQMASEKVGVGLRFYEADVCPSEALVEDPFNATGACTNPYLEKMGIEAFGSGLLYNTTNLKTEKTFNDFVFSVGLAAHFRLGLVARAAHGWGFNGGKFQHHVTQFAMDVPLADYLVELAKKK